MAMNRVQFQPGLSMVEFMQQYGTEAKCYRALYRARWPQGFRCPACHERRRSRFRRGTQIYYQCRACRHQTTLLSGTIFQGTKLPLRTWMLAIHLLTSTKTNMAALELMRHLGVNYKRPGASSTRSCRRWPSAKRRASCPGSSRSTTPTWAGNSTVASPAAARRTSRRS